MRSGYSGIFRDLNGPFDDTPYWYLSPVLGMDCISRANDRKHILFGPKKILNVKRPACMTEASIPFHPQSYSASLLERLFPSNFGLVVNSNAHDYVNKYFTPANIAEIFKIFVHPDFKNIDRSKNQYVCHIIPSQLQTIINDKGETVINKEVSNKDAVSIELNAAERMIFDILLQEDVMRDMVSDKTFCLKTKVRLMKIRFSTSIEKTAELATLLVKAFDENNDNKAIKILLAYMWEKNKYSKKEKLKPYIKVLRKAGIIDKSRAKKILWSGEGSEYTKEDFDAIKSLPDYLRRHTEITPLEYIALLRDGSAHFADVFPPAIEFGRSYLQSGAIKNFYSDCGDTIIRNFFIMLLFDYETGKIDVSRLHKLKEMGFDISEKLIKFFTKHCTDLSKINTPVLRAKWSKVVSNLNKNDGSPKVRYLHPDPVNGTYGIDAGIDNFLLVIMKLLGGCTKSHVMGYPYFYQFNMRMYFKLHCIQNLDTIIAMFKRVTKTDKFIHTIEFDQCENVGEFDIHALSYRVPKDGWTGFALVVRYQGQDEDHVFKLHFDKKHFDFVKIQNSAQLEIIRNIDLLKSEYKLDHSDNTPEINKITAMCMDSIDDRIKALEAVFAYTSQSKSDAFQHLIARWLDVSGFYFGGWQNSDVVGEVVAILVRHMSTSEILQLTIQEFSSELVWYHVKRGEFNGIVLVLSNDLREGKPEQFAGALTKTLKYCGDEEFALLLKADAMVGYTKSILSHSIPHLLAMSGNKFVKVPLSQYGLNVNAISHEGFAALYYAIMNFSTDMVATLLAQGATTAKVSKDGKTALDIAIDMLATSNPMRIDSFTFFKGFSVSTRFRDIIDIVDLLVKHGSDFNRNTDNYKQYAYFVRQYISILMNGSREMNAHQSDVLCKVLAMLELDNHKAAQLANRNKFFRQEEHYSENAYNGSVLSDHKNPLQVLG